MLNFPRLGSKIYNFLTHETYPPATFWLVRFFLYLLAAWATPGAVRTLAQVAAAGSLRARRVALASLQKNGGQQHINEVCQVWDETRDKALGTLLVERGWLADAPPRLKVVSALQAERGWFLKPDEANLLWLTKTIFQEKSELARGALVWFYEFKDLAALAAALRSDSDFVPLLKDLTASGSFFQRHPAGLAVILALRANRSELLAQAGAEVVAPLLELGLATDEKLAQTARDFVGALQNSAARDELCSLALAFNPREEEKLALKLALVYGFHPRESYPRAKFFFLTEQWEKYETLDFEASLMRAVYEASDEITRKRIARLGRVAGRPELGRIIGSKSRTARQLSGEEWELLTQNLIEQKRWSEAFDLARVAPPVQAAALLKALTKAGWWPENEAAQLTFLDLSERAKNLTQPAPPLGRQLKVQAKYKLDLGNLHSFGLTQLSPDKQLFATIRTGGFIDLWNVTKGELVRTLPPDFPLINSAPYSPQPGEFEVTALTFSPDTKFLAIADFWRANQRGYYRLRLFDFEKSEMQLLPMPKNLAELRYIYPSFIRAFTFSPDGKYLAMLLRSVGIYLWQAAAPGKFEFFLEKKTYWYSNFLAFSSDSKNLIWSASPSELAFESLATNATRKIAHPTTNLIQNAFFSPNGRYLVTTDDHQHLRCFQLYPESPDVGFARGGFDEIYSWAFSPDGTRLATSHHGVIRIWEFPTLVLVKTVWSNRRDYAVTSLYFSDDGQTLHSFDETGHVKVWSTRLSRTAHRATLAATVADLGFTRKAQLDSALPGIERAWLQFMEALFAQQAVYDIEISDVAPVVEAGQFDIELDG